MKNLCKVLIFLCSVHMTYALQGLRITVQSPDVVLSWPSDDSQPNSYAILYRASLADPWQVLATYYPPDYGTNTTYYTDPGAGVHTSGLYDVVMMGPNPYNLTNGQTLSGIVVIPVEAYEPSGNLDAMTLYCDDSPVPSTAHVAPFERPVPLLVLDTTQLANGPHNFSVLCEYRDYSALVEYEDTSTPEISVVVSNVISFPDWLPFFGETGNNALITAQCPSNSDFYIDIYGDTNRYIGTMSGHTPDGNIYIPWDLTGPGGTVVQNDSQFSMRVVVPIFPGPVVVTNTPPTKLMKINDPWIGPGDWVVANQQAFENVIGWEELDTMSDGWSEIPIQLGLTCRPSANQSYRIRVDPIYAGGDWFAVASAMYNPHSRNMFYFGHGGPYGIGQYSNVSSGFYAMSSEIGTNLHNIPLNSTNCHKYRFVCLDGCETAAGNLPEAFGIPAHKQVPLANYQNAGLRPNAYVGWLKKKTIAFGDHVVNDCHIWYFYWLEVEWATNGNGIKTATDNAAAYPQVTGSTMDLHDLRVFGCWELGVNDYNQ